MRKFNVLLVDDNRHFLEAFEFMLSDVIGDRIVNISKVTNGQECLDFLENNSVEIVFMDLDMPVMNGIQTTKIIVDKYRFINIIAVSFHNEMQSIRDMIEAGARNYLIKEDINRESITRIFDSI
ncbi:MAG TPA: response regulator [Bacteroidales bacterium]|nr:response regulator [Bacteroidales bacterium]